MFVAGRASSHGKYFASYVDARWFGPWGTEKVFWLRSRVWIKRHVWKWSRWCESKDFCYFNGHAWPRGSPWNGGVQLIHTLLRLHSLLPARQRRFSILFVARMLPQGNFFFKYSFTLLCRACREPGLGDETKLIFDGYRTYLSTASRGRRRRVGYRGQLYEYYRECTRPPPKIRDNDFVGDAIAFAIHRKSPFMGHKRLPLMSRWPGFDWYRMNPPDVMHGLSFIWKLPIYYIYKPNYSLTVCSVLLFSDSKIVCEMLLKIMIGPGLRVVEDLQGGWRWSKDSKHRRESQELGIFRDIWPDRDGPLPWRLTRDQLRILNKRMQRIVWPHYMDRMYYDGCSFWLKPGRLWKSRRKVIIIFILVNY